MFIEERHREISDTIKVNGKITIAEITGRFGISDESARRDLRLLEQKGVCKRTHGGAIALGQVSVRPPVDRDFDHMPVFDNYREISRAAVKKIRENDTVYLTGGSFGHIMVSFLPRDIRYTVIVNSVDIGKELRSFDNIDVYVAGGKMRQSGSLVDSLANEFVSRIHFDLCFITGAGLTAEFGLSNGTDETAAFQRTVIKNSRKKCLVLPSSKIGIDSFIKVCDADAFDYIITDWDCAEDQIAAIEKEGVEVTIVEEPQNGPRAEITESDS
ncbi:MAG: DeoR/GlpR transcriptional regulator [Oscillibacter sp.]|nr:DeoR/GlpR transcriptional regulator [Oscillibacter sp.]